MASGSPNDESLLGRIQEGDSLAFATLVRRHTERYHRLAYRYTARREEAEDIVQAAFIKLWETPDIWDSRGGARFTTWFYRVVVNLCLDRKKKRGAGAIPESYEMRDDSLNPEREVAGGEVKDLLAREIAGLPPRQRTALILCFYEDLSHGDAAGAMNISVSAFRSLLMRAKTALKQKMSQYL